MKQAADELAVLTRRFEERRRPGATRGLVPVVQPFAEAMVEGVRPGMLGLVAGVVLMLLLATANVANLLLMRGESRRMEIAIRDALGAGRGAIVRMLFVESALLTAPAAVPVSP